MVSGLTEPQLKTVRSTYSLPWSGSCVKSSKPRQWSLTGQILQAEKVRPVSKMNPGKWNTQAKESGKTRETRNKKRVGPARL